MRLTSKTPYLILYSWKQLFRQILSACFQAIALSILNRSHRNYAHAISKSRPNSGRKLAQLYLIFQKLDHMT